MDLFQNARTVRLKSCHDKFLTADEDEESVNQDRNGAVKSCKWTVEFVKNKASIIRLRSCYNKYLTASNHRFLFGIGMTGRKVTQTHPSTIDSPVEWEPIRENGAVKLKTRCGQFLRANGGLPPWRNSVTHDIPYRTATHEWILWEVHVVEILVEQSPAGKEESFASETISPSATPLPMPTSFSESNGSLVSSPPKASDGRLIYFHMANENGEVEEGFEEICISFKGNDVYELTTRLEAELGIEGIVVCTRSPSTGKLYPLRLQLPPNNATMHVCVVPPSPQAQDSAKSDMPL